MRLAAVAIVALLTLPFVGSLGPVPTRTATDDLPDADLVLLLAQHEGIPAHRPAPVALPPSATVDGLVLKLAARSGHPLAPRDAAPFLHLDPKVALPVATLLAAIDRAWDLRDQAFAKLTPAQLARLDALARQADFSSPEYQALAQQVDYAPLIDAAILLLDTAESVAIPALQDAIAQGAWPPTAIADPVGVLRLGSPGNDVETVDRILQIDPSGDDTYLNNAGGTTMTLTTSAPKTPVSLSLDFAGNDVYVAPASESAPQGGGDLGVGVLLDFGGDDHYRCNAVCQGGSVLGVGVARDYAGNDNHTGFERSLGYGGPIGILRDDLGDDTYYGTAFMGGFGEATGSIGLLWDRSGADQYVSRGPGSNFGWSLGGDGWLVDEGQEQDAHRFENGQTIGHACNDCVWRAGSSGIGSSSPTGLGSDNSGGISRILSARFGP